MGKSPKDETPKPEDTSLERQIREALARGTEEQEAAPEDIRRRVMVAKGPRLSAWKQQITSLLGRVSHKEMLLFCRQLALLLECGMPLVRSLNTLAERTTNIALSRVIREIGTAIEGGSTFTDAVRRYPRHFNELMVAMIHAGEKSGKLTDAMLHIAEQGEKIRAAKSRALVSMLYPLIVIVLALVVIAVPITMVIDAFSEFMAELKMEPTWQIAALIRIGGWVRNWHFWFGVIVVIGGLITSYAIGERSRVFRLLRDRLLLRIPGVRYFVMEAIVARFARIFSMLMEAGVPLVESLQATHDTMKNELLRLTLSRAIESVRGGQGLVGAIERGAVFPPLVVDLLSIGEEAGALERVSRRIADVYEQQLETDVAALGAILRPALVLVLALLIGFVAFGFFGFYMALLGRMSQMTGV